VKDSGPPERPAHDAGFVRRVPTNVEPNAAIATPSQGPRAGGTDIHQLLLQDTPSSIAAARAILEPKVFGNRATAEEIRMLKSICKSQHDEICVEKCKSLLGQ
jgi:hypothetical protein